MTQCIFVHKKSLHFGVYEKNASILFLLSVNCSFFATGRRRRRKKSEMIIIAQRFFLFFSCKRSRKKLKKHSYFFAFVIFNSDDLTNVFLYFYSFRMCQQYFVHELKGSEKKMANKNNALEQCFSTFFKSRNLSKISYDLAEPKSFK
jgi:hypothetical protein